MRVFKMSKIFLGYTKQILGLKYLIEPVEALLFKWK